MDLVKDSPSFQKKKLVQPIFDEPKKLPKIVVAGKQEIIRTRLDLLNEICGTARSLKQLAAVYSTIIEMTRYALNASASSVILFDEQNKSIIHRFSDGPLGKQVVKLSSQEQLGMAALVLHSGKSLKVNAIDEDERFGKFKEETAGIVVRSAIAVPLIVNQTVIGVLEVLNRLDGNDFNDADLVMMEGLAAGVTMTIENSRINEHLLLSYRNTVQKRVAARDTRELSESKHSRRVADYALIAADHLSLPDGDKKNIEYGAILHDIGMLGIPSGIFKKKGKLTAEDWNLIRKHPVMGGNLLRGIPSLDPVSKLILYHHERYDGKGYPSGLKGDTIPLNAQIISVAEAFDAMTVKHAYRNAISPEAAMKELGKYAGTQFSPDAVKALCMGYIRKRSLNRIKPRQEKVVTDYFKNQHGESSTWKINFGQSSRVGGEPPVAAPPAGEAAQ